ncbi:MAG: hypothetical protein NZ602_07880 [Thermoguttaceae bacterium]|nr:hypothetical protein [Thermoguttaceae bacterium]MDW8038441.1 hypothetical protein [Thermoguttaceae bacterium]
MAKVELRGCLKRVFGSVGRQVVSPTRRSYTLGFGHLGYPELSPAVGTKTGYLPFQTTSKMAKVELRGCPKNGDLAGFPWVLPNRLLSFRLLKNRKIPFIIENTFSDSL